MATAPVLRSQAAAMDGASQDRRRVRGQRSRQAVLERSVQLASELGLEGLSIGMLAADLGTTKSRLQGLFGNKEGLQLATLEAAKALLIEVVVAPAINEQPGLARLRATGSAWFDYLGGPTFAGGCFLCSASAEMDGRPGPVRDAVAAVMREWLDWLEFDLQTAVDAGEADPTLDVPATAFRLNALGMAANWQRQLFDDYSGITYGRAAWSAELDRLTVHLQSSPKGRP